MYCSEALSDGSKLLHAKIPKGRSSMQKGIHCARRLLYASHEVIPQEGNERRVLSR